MLPYFAASASPVVKSCITSFEVGDYWKIQAPQVALVLVNCMNLKNLYIDNCEQFSAPKLLELLRETPTVCSLKELSLEPHEEHCFDKQTSRDWGLALTEFKKIFSARSDAFTLITKVCACGSYLPEEPYVLTLEC
jgi:hypothetical protein